MKPAIESGFQMVLAGKSIGDSLREKKENANSGIEFHGISTLTYQKITLEKIRRIIQILLLQNYSLEWLILFFIHWFGHTQFST